jgi:prepilin-type N-terminal cleavage/methylation domain-containing protein
MNCKSGNVRARSLRAGLTLLELVVVLVILAALAAMVVPRLSGVVAQSNSATNASLVEDVNRAVGLFEARYNKQPSGWDSLLNSSDAYFSKLHPNLTQATDVTKPKLRIVELDAGQAQSLQAAKITGFHDADEARTSAPSDNSSVFRFLATGTKVVMLEEDNITSGHGSTFIDNAFSLNQYRRDGRGKQVLADYDYVVVGLGGPTSIKGMTMQEIPLVQSANPVQYYARMICVFKVPKAGATGADVTPAEFVGSFLPDGTSLRGNVDSFNSSNS